MEIALLAFVKDENKYLEEWINHYRSIGISNVYLGDNNSTIPIKTTIDKLGIPNISVTTWKDENIGGQMRWYEYAIKHLIKEPWVIVVDIDEFTILRGYKPLQEFISSIRAEQENIGAIGLYWRLYGSPSLIENRIPALEYKHYHENGHIKSIIKVSHFIGFKDPHFPTVRGEVIDENGKYLNGPIGTHTSRNAWIHHNWSRSLEEYKEKMIRGRGDKVPHSYDLQEFENYNKRCVLIDNKE